MDPNMHYYKPVLVIQCRKCGKTFEVDLMNQAEIFPTSGIFFERCTHCGIRSVYSIYSDSVQAKSVLDDEFELEETGV